MSYQIYFLQNEDDAVRFLDALSELKAIVWTGNAFKFPSELKDDIKKQMSSYFCKYTIIPQTAEDILRFNDSNASADMMGIEFLACCKRNELSRTYEVGRIYYKKNEGNGCNEQMLLLFQRIKRFVRKNYSYSKNVGIYVAPCFKQRFEDNYFHATQLGRPIAL